MTNSALEADLHKTLQEKFSFQDFRVGQLDILKSIFSGRDTLAVMPTGRGKSLCYQLPAFHRPGIVLVVSPLISLMRDQVRGLENMGLPVGCLHSGQAMAEKRAVFARLKSEPHSLLYLSPERVQKEGFAAWLPQQNISLMAIDEAHCVSQWGHDFRQDYHRLTLLRELQPKVPILALTATATPQVLNDITRQLGLNNPDRHVYGFYRPNLYYQVEFCEDIVKKERYLRQALKEFPEGRVIIYCGTRNQCEALSEVLKYDFPSIGYYHAGLPPETRVATQKLYDSGEIRILCATNAFGMGVDHPDVRLIVHYQVPANIESYYQEMGRAGRDGKPSTCLLLYAKKDRGLQTFFIREAEVSETVKKARWRALDAITQFAEGGECRHSGILTYFRDAQRIRACGHCDICAPNTDRKVSPPSRPTFSAVSIPPKVATRPKKEPKETIDWERPLTREEELRYEVMKQWRKDYADEVDLPAFMIFSNKSLRDLVVRNPTTPAELERCYGFGPQRTESLGARILEKLKEIEPGVS